MPTTTDLAAGQTIGGVRILEHRDGRLRVSPPRLYYLLMLAGALAAMVAGFMRMRTRPGGLFAFDNDWGDWLFGLSVIPALIAVFMASTTYTFDSAARRFTQSLLVFSKSWSGDQIHSVLLEVRHIGPREFLFLSLDLEGQKVPRQITEGPSDERSIELPALAARIAELLGVRLIRAGEAVQGGDAVEEQLQRVADVQVGGDNRDLVFNCPACGRQNTRGVAYEHQEHYHGAPVRTTHWVKCLECGSSLYSRVHVDQLIGLSPAELEPLVVYRVSLISRVTAILAIATSLFPFVGLAMSVLAFILCYRTRGWPRKLSLIALCIGALTSVLVAALMMVK